MEKLLLKHPENAPHKDSCLNLHQSVCGGELHCFKANISELLKRMSWQILCVIYESYVEKDPVNHANKMLTHYY